MQSTTYYQVLVQLSEPTTMARAAVDWAAVAAVGALLPVTIFVIVICALAWRSVRLSPGEQAYTLQLLDRLIRLARTLWSGNRGGR
ncbi:hypothetical protein E0H75_42295 [Kribbella capetownensis]|uniref:Uncharacterized protein n=1 Tax=Kribbella capetownensis TaxID=1572659 RepID=A0A4R0IK69_9ACTN|nr:hypothetical protein [Kribbella capetownensis]TCC33891.1 hypothetical protein E0H75_42295 [Kribbella capetownensis]